MVIKEMNQLEELLELTLHLTYHFQNIIYHDDPNKWFIRHPIRRYQVGCFLNYIYFNCFILLLA